MTWLSMSFRGRPIVFFNDRLPSRWHRRRCLRPGRTTPQAQPSTIEDRGHAARESPSASLTARTPWYPQRAPQARLRYPNSGGSRSARKGLAAPKAIAWSTMRPGHSCKIAFREISDVWIALDSRQKQGSD
jgi:hypothetical protein